MNGLRLSTSHRFGWRDALLGAALFAALLRALIPAGFMPQVDNGRIAMVICTADGARTLYGEPLQKSAAGVAMTAAQMPCAFAAMAAMAPPPEAPVVSLSMAIERRLVTLDETTPEAADAPFRPQAPRAPPSLHA